MQVTYLLPKARNVRTGQTIKAQDLTGSRFGLHQRVIAEDAAVQLAANMSAKTGESWVGFVEQYTPTQRQV